VQDIERCFNIIFSPICQQRNLLYQLIHKEFLVAKGCEGKEIGFIEKIKRQCSETNDHFVDILKKIGKSFIITQFHD
jgi:hypothetical protein